MKSLTKSELSRAQFLHHCYTRANEISDEIDPGRNRVTRYDTIATVAGDEFIALTGEHVTRVRFVDLNTERAAKGGV